MKVLIVGNCQTRPVAEILSLSSSKVKVIGEIIVHLAKHDDVTEHAALYEDADVILAQRVASNYPVQHVSTEYILSQYPEKVVTWVNVFFQGQNPDLHYITSTYGGRVMGPMDAYHSKALFTLWKSGIKSNEIDEIDYISRTISVEELTQRINNSLNSLQVREEGVDIGMHDYVNENWKYKPLFHTFNHPNLTTIVELGRRICDYMGLPSINLDSNQLSDKLDLIVPPIEQDIAKRIGMQFKTPRKVAGLELSQDMKSTLPGKRMRYEFAEFVDATFKSYDAQERFLNSVKYTPA